MTGSFWKEALASLPPEVQGLYAADFEKAERVEDMIDLSFEAWGFTRNALAKACHAVALALRTTARILEGAARRLSLAHQVKGVRSPRL